MLRFVRIVLLGSSFMVIGSALVYLDGSLMLVGVFALVLGLAILAIEKIRQRV